MVTPTKTLAVDVVALRRQPRFQHTLQASQGGCGKSLDMILRLAESFLLPMAANSISKELQTRVCPADMVQESLMDVHLGIRNFNGKHIRQFRSWLRTILYRNLISEYRRLPDVCKRGDGGCPSVDFDEMPQTRLPSPCDVAEFNDDRRVVREELQKMPKHYRMVIELRHHKRLKFNEIGDQLDKSEDACRMICTRAFDRLTHAIGRRFECTRE